MALSTLGPEGTWTVPLGFDATDDMLITFQSQPESQHAHDVQSNPKRAVGNLQRRW
jgi:hypothetical protein